MLLTQRLAFATVLATLILVGIGVYVRATGSGLGCPDWPTCHGGVVPPGSRQSVIEYSHRFVAALVGLMVIAVAILAWRHYRHRPFVVWSAMLAVPLVGVQGLIGALTVRHELPPEIVATHLLTAMLVLACQLAAAFSMLLDDPEQPSLQPAARASWRPAARASLVALVWLSGVVWIGGYLGESGGSTACSDWPACNGSTLIPTGDDQEITHMLHRFVAGALVFFIAPVLIAAWRERSRTPWAKTFTLGLAAFYAAQVVVGALNVLYTFPDPLAVSHTVIAAGIWSTLVSAVMLGFYAPAAERRRRSVSAAEVPA